MIQSPSIKSSNILTTMVQTQIVQRTTILPTFIETINPQTVSIPSTQIKKPRIQITNNATIIEQIPTTQKETTLTTIVNILETKTTKTPTIITSQKSIFYITEQNINYTYLTTIPQVRVPITSKEINTTIIKFTIIKDKYLFSISFII